MPDVVLMRHGIAEEPVPGRSDADRALTERGRVRARAAAADLAGVLGPVDRLASSDLVRACETADLLAEAIPVSERLVLPELRPESDPEAVFRWLGALPGGVTILVGHEPQMNLLLGVALTGTPRSLARFRKAGVAWLTFPGALRPGGGRLEAFLPPALAFSGRTP